MSPPSFLKGHLMIKTDSTTLLPQSFLVSVHSWFSTNALWNDKYWYLWIIWRVEFLENLFPILEEVHTKWKSAWQTKINQRSAEPHHCLRTPQRSQQWVRVAKSFTFLPEKTTGGLFKMLPKCSWSSHLVHLEVRAALLELLPPRLPHVWVPPLLQTLSLLT